jgi:hypothetical protein
MDYTHIVVTHSSDDKEYLYRASDGARIGGRQHAVVVFGDNPNKSESRVFIDAVSASNYLRGTVTAEDLKVRGQEPKPWCDVRNGDPAGIIIPDTAVQEEFMGGHTRIRKVV